VRDLGFFESVEVTRQPGSAPDRANLTVEVQEKATGDLTIGGGFSTDFGALANLGLRERNFLGTGIDARINTLLAQRRSQVDLSVTDPAFLDRNLLGGFDVFYVVNTNLNSASFDERRVGFALRLGYEISDTLRQTWNYTYSDREIFNIDRDASRFVRQQEGKTLLSQIGQTLTYDRRDSRIDPKDGYVTRLGTDFAGIGGDVQYMRVRADGAYYQPIGPITGTDDYVLVFAGSAGKLFSFDDGERIIDRFFLGGENLRGFRAGGAGPRDTATNDSLGGTIIATASIELRFPLPVPDDFGITGRVFTDMGILTDLSDQGPTVVDDGEPRVSVGFGFGWRSPFGLVNVDLGFPIIKKSYDRTEMFRFGFGTRF
jgi:outer membrane protein insertion porin family